MKECPDKLFGISWIVRIMTLLPVLRTSTKPCSYGTEPKVTRAVWCSLILTYLCLCEFIHRPFPGKKNFSHVQKQVTTPALVPFLRSIYFSDAKANWGSLPNTSLTKFTAETLMWTLCKPVSTMEAVIILFSFSQIITAPPHWPG